MLMKLLKMRFFFLWVCSFFILCFLVMESTKWACFDKYELQKHKQKHRRGCIHLKKKYIYMYKLRACVVQFVGDRI